MSGTSELSWSVQADAEARLTNAAQGKETADLEAKQAEQEVEAKTKLVDTAAAGITQAQGAVKDAEAAVATAATAEKDAEAAK